jgi:hypothetical protein
MLYGVSSREIIFNGEHDFEDMRKGAFYWNDLEVEDPEMKLMYRVFNGN